MKPKLNWFQLRFPRDLEKDNALAALSAFSGLPHRSRLVIDLSADHSGSTHCVAVSADATEIATAALRAAMPSLRLQAIDTPPMSARRWLLQLSPRIAVLRTDDLAAVAASLLSSLFPLEPGETIRLTWHLRSAVRPVAAFEPDKSPDGRRQAVRAKLALPGLAAHGELRVSATDPGAQRPAHAAHRLQSAEPDNATRPSRRRALLVRHTGSPIRAAGPLLQRRRTGRRHRLPD